ncbi:MAG: hypothetical protein KJ941_07805 [Bacteroidetes bacterium]|nr:hypothetical protein [Bacteroidota bacterium]
MKNISIFILSLVLLLGCVKNNPAPVWLEINPWTLEVNPNASDEAGELSHGFTNVKVFVNDQSIGIFELPIKLPLLDVTGDAKVELFPVVINNGISATKKAYPFMESHIETVNFKQNETSTVNPKTRYFSETTFWIEDFEDAAVKIEVDDNSKAYLLKENQPDKLKYGNFYGSVKLNSTDNLFLALTNGKLLLPKGREVYLEIDYRSTNNLVTGLIELSSSLIKDHINIQMNGQPESTVVWKKIYIDLREIVTATPQAEYYEISFRAPLDEGETEGEIIIDNVKVVHY